MEVICHLHTSNEFKKLLSSCWYLRQQATPVNRICCVESNPMLFPVKESQSANKMKNEQIPEECLHLLLSKHGLDKTLAVIEISFNSNHLRG